MEEAAIHNTILIDDDKKNKSNDEANEDIFEKIFDEIKENYQCEDGETKEEKEEPEDIKEEKKEKKETQKNAETNVGSFEIVDDINVGPKKQESKECNSDTDDW